MHALCEFKKMRNDRITREIDDACGSGRILRHSGRTAKHGQSDATPGFFFMVELVAFLGSTVERIQHRVTGTHDAILERQMTQRERLQQWVFGNHSAASRLYGYIQA